MNNTENDIKITFIDKILDEMKSEFNKSSSESNETESENPDLDIQPPQLQAETDVVEIIDRGGVPPEIPRFEDGDIGDKSKRKSKSADDEVDKPRIVLTLRTEKSKSCDEIKNDKSPSGRRSLRIKTTEEKKSEPNESGLKRSARRRSKDCSESILQSAIARKEKSYNETTRPQRLTRRLKPTAKILANLEMCQKNALLRTERQKLAESKIKNQNLKTANIKKEDADGEIKEPVKMSERLYKKLKHKKHKSGKNKRLKTEKAESDSECSGSSRDIEADSKGSDSKEVDVKPFRRSHRRSSGRIQEEEMETNEPLFGSVPDNSMVPADPESSVVIGEHTNSGRCLCETVSLVYAVNSSCNNISSVFCNGMDSYESQTIGCNNVIHEEEILMLRPSTRVPFMVLCKVHRQRLKKHNCCPACGLFCLRGQFSKCLKGHVFHKECANTQTKDSCPHCGEPVENEIEIILKSNEKLVFLPKQKEYFPSAKMSAKSQHCAPIPSPPLIGNEIIDTISSWNASEEVSYGPADLFEAVAQNQPGRVTVIISNGNVELSQSWPNANGGTTLHLAAREGFLGVVHVLMSAGAEHDLFDNDQNTPLMLAAAKSHNDVVRYFVARRVTSGLKGTDGMTALHLAAKNGNTEGCRILLERGGERVDTADDGGWTALVWACEHAHEETARYLLERGAEPHTRDVEQNVALHWAAFSGSVAIAQQLLDRNSDVTAANAHGDTPLHVAARQDRLECALLLLARGANPRVHNMAGEAPADCAPPGDCRCTIALTAKLDGNRTKPPLSQDISRGREPVPVSCVNLVDDEPTPNDFIYATYLTTVAGARTLMADIAKCACTGSCSANGCACADRSLGLWYDEEGRLLDSFNFANSPLIFECNTACECNAISCQNRVVQHGLQQRLQVFRTEGKGWGLRTLKKMARGVFVIEYIGELISDVEADSREDDNYVFDLDSREEEDSYCIDSRNFGNAARFINHSCEANLVPIRIFVEQQDLRFPRVAFFTSRPVEAGEELSFDYGDKFWSIKNKMFPCKCCSNSCRYSGKLK